MMGEVVFQALVEGKPLNLIGKLDVPHTYTFVVDHQKYERVFGGTPTPHREAIRQTISWFYDRHTPDVIC
jgi:hypothetical protein